jgi:DNA mismatch repair protein MutS
LFATHYHELTQLADFHAGIANARVAVALSGEHGIRFLYRLERGVAERSYGILVAKLAGLPEDVLGTAQGMLEQLEAQARQLSVESGSNGQLMLKLDNVPKRPKKRTPLVHDDTSAGAAASPQNVASAPTVDPGSKAVIDDLRAVDLNNLTPMQALSLLWKWRERLPR